MRLRKVIERREIVSQKNKVVTDLRSCLESATEYDEEIKAQVLADIDALLLAVYSDELGQIDNAEVAYGKEEGKGRGPEVERRPPSRKGGSSRAKRETRRARAEDAGHGSGGGSTLQ